MLACILPHSTNNIYIYIYILLLDLAKLRSLGDMSANNFSLAIVSAYFCPIHWGGVKATAARQRRNPDGRQQAIPVWKMNVDLTTLCLLTLTCRLALARTSAAFSIVNFFQNNLVSVHSLAQHCLNYNLVILLAAIDP